MTTGWSADVISALKDLSERSGVALTATSDGLAVGTSSLPLPALKGERAGLFGIEGLLPTVPRGDDRDKLLWRILAEAGPGETPDRWSPPPLDAGLAEALESSLPFDAEANETIAEAMRERFYSSKPAAKVLLPLHGTLPRNYAHSTRVLRTRSTPSPARYRMFSGEILPFLLYNSETDRVDERLVAQLTDLFSTEEDLTALDLLFLKIARDRAQEPEALPSAAALLGRREAGVRADMARAGGPFCAPSLQLFQRDLATVLSTALPRPDKVQWLTLLLSVHLGIRLYRMAEVLGNELDLAVAAASRVKAPSGARACACSGAGDPDSLGSCPLAGQIRFRVGSGRYRPVSRRDGCRSSYLELDQQKLLALPATLVTTNLALLAWTALGGPDRTGSSSAALADALTRDSGLARLHGAACAAIAVLHHATHRPKAPLHELVEVGGSLSGRSGLHALREDVLRLRRSDLRHQSRDVVNQLLLDLNAGGAGSLISRNGTHTFFEIDERLTVLLVRLVCRDEQLPFERFVSGLASYGLAPQDAAERAALADTLERLGLLARFSDSGEASFVHYT